jgi:hypothetical protein
MPLNTMGLNGPAWAGNYIQPNTATPTVNPRVPNYATGADILGVNAAGAIPVYVQPGTTYPAIPASQLKGGPMGQGS